MAERRDFQMTPEEFGEMNTKLSAARAKGPAPGSDRLAYVREASKAFWDGLGLKYGFNPDTVLAHQTGGELWFTAEVDELGEEF
jgi:hypothetical protein